MLTYIDERFSSFTDNDLLPDGRKFSFWDCTTEFTKTYYVDNKNINASDDNDGSEEMPFVTINRAASAAKAGERILIKEGVYHETIRDVNGGTDEEHMILFEGQGNVVITGAVKWKCNFTVSEGLRESAPKCEHDLFTPDKETYYMKNGAKVYMGEIPTDTINDGYNPFSIMNLSPNHFGSFENSVPLLLKRNSLDVFNPDSQLMKRGLLFCDGERMEQVARPHELWREPGSYWVDESGRFIHFRLKNDKSSSPCTHTFELAIKEQGFAPKKSGLSYIYLKNLTFEKFSNPFPSPQKGAVSTNCGHHFIIEGCIIKDINSIGADMGFLSHYHLHDGIRGHHIIRNNSFINCGISGLSALPTRGEHLKCMLVENNTFKGNCWHNSEPIWECAAIKNHYTEDSLFRNNIITDTYFGAGIWLDKAIKNTRVCNNTIIGVEHSLYGGILIEATYYNNLVDHNFIYGTGNRITPLGVKTGGHGIFLNEVDGLWIYKNLIFNVVGDGVFTPPGVENPRLIGTSDPRSTSGSENIVLHNIINNAKRAATVMTRENRIDGNILGVISEEPFIIRNEKKTFSIEGVRSAFGFEKNGIIAEIEVKFDRLKLSAEITINGSSKSLDLKNDNAVLNYMKKITDNVQKDSEIK